MGHRIEKQSETHGRLIHMPIPDDQGFEVAGSFGWPLAICEDAKAVADRDCAFCARQLAEHKAIRAEFGKT